MRGGLELERAPRGDARRWTRAHQAALSLAGCFLALAVCACPSGGTAAPPRGLDPVAPNTSDSIIGVARSVAAIGHPHLVSRLRRDPFSFFRYVGGPFVAATCEGFADEASELPEVNLHGDAHVEQYAVAADGRGLADFDAATTGPFVVDLVRFATSLRLAARVRGLGVEAGDRALTEFLRGYRAALRDPRTAAPEPSVVARVRQRFAPDAGTWLDRVESLMTPLDPPMKAKIESANAGFVAEMRRQNPDLGESFFEMRRVGILKMGVGSANEKKFLARVAGPSAAPEDDVIYEVKEVMRIEPGTCVTGDPVRDPRRVIRGQARLSGVHQRFLGFIDLDGRSFYVHTWRVNYTELDVDDLRTARELAEVAFDVGLQLGRGHPQEMQDPPGVRLPVAIASSLDRVEPRIREASRQLEVRTVTGWEELVRRAPAPAPGPAPEADAAR
jgi:hypothetical protein